MKRSFVTGLVCLLAFSFADWGAGAAIAAGGCPGAVHLKGAYGLDLRGSTTTGQPYVAVGVLRLHAGRFSLDLTSSLGGSVMTHDLLEGSASEEGCSLTLTSNDSSFCLHGQIGQVGKRILVAGTDARANPADPVVAGGKLRKIGFNRCKDRTLHGSYNYLSQGFDSLSGPPVAPLAKTGEETFHGNGCSFYRETIVTSTQVEEVTPAYLAYHVYPDCSFELLEDHTPVFYGVLVDKGRSAPYMTLADGATRNGEYTESPQNPPVPGVCPR